MSKPLLELRLQQLEARMAAIEEARVLPPGWWTSQKELEAYQAAEKLINLRKHEMSLERLADGIEIPD